MKISKAPTERADEITKLFEDTFSASEGPDEGAVIGTLVHSQFETTPPSDLHVFVAEDAGTIIASAILTPLVFAEDSRRVVLLSPVAVSPQYQRQGIGQKLLQYALDALRADGADVAITYGDPNYYVQVGFEQITEEVASAPLPLQQPEGWLAQSLTSAPLTPLKGSSSCVPALRNPSLW